jgi:hypothetical protein
MYTDLDKKIDNLSNEDKLLFYSELTNILNDKYSASNYGITGRDYNCLPMLKVEGAKEKLYKEMFEKGKKKD